MKVLITAQGDTMDAPVEQKFGRAPWFIVIDLATEDWQAFDNRPTIEAGGDLGVQAGGQAASLGADLVITGDVGPKAHRMLTAAGLSVCRVDDGLTVGEAFTRFVRRGLASIQEPTVDGGECRHDERKGRRPR